MALDNSAELMGSGGLPEMLFRWALVTPFAVAIISFIFWLPFALLGRARGRVVPYRVQLKSAFGASLLIIVWAIWLHTPRHHFNAYVYDPEPTSVRNVLVGRTTSFGDGGAWYFAFEIDPNDFWAIVRARSMVEWSVDWKAAADDARASGIEDSPRSAPAFNGERPLANWDGYKRVEGGRVFIGPRILAVADRDLRHVQLMIDHFSDPVTPR